MVLSDTGHHFELEVRHHAMIVAYERLHMFDLHPSSEWPHCFSCGFTSGFTLGKKGIIPMLTHQFS